MSAIQLTLLILCGLVLQQMLPAVSVTGTAAMTAAGASSVPSGFDVPHDSPGSRVGR